MKRIYLLNQGLLFFTLFMMCLMPITVQAAGNDYLEKQSNYTIRASGPDVIHFSIPVYSVGAANNYYVHRTSYAYVDGDGVPSTTIAYFYAVRSKDDPENAKEDDKGAAYLNMKKGRAIVTSMQNGINKLVEENANSGKLIVKKGAAGDRDYVTTLEFDWYPPTSLNNKTFSIHLQLYIYRNQADPKDNNQSYKFTFHYDNSGSKFKTNDNVIAPQLMEPYLYTANEYGVTGYGAAAVPYMTFQNTYGYWTSLDPNTFWPKTERAGMIYVATTDTVQPNYSVVFKQVRSVQSQEMINCTTNVVSIPPYHRIHDFSVVEETDSTSTYTGNHILSWTIKNPNLKDIVDGDMFEVERALKSDFSDAKQITVLSMNRNKSNYTYVDNNRSTWTGNAKTKTDTISRYVSYVTQNPYTFYDDAGNVTYKAHISIKHDKVLISSVPVYYRIRRASSSVWGWNHDLVKKATLQNLNYLAPLADTQKEYTKDADFETNHKVNFQFRIENRNLPAASFPEEGFQLNVHSIECVKDSVNVLIMDDSSRPSDDEYPPQYEIFYQGNRIQSLETIRGVKEFKVPRGAVITFVFPNLFGTFHDRYTISDSRGFHVRYRSHFLGSSIVDDGILTEKNPWTPAIQQYLLDSLKPLLIAQYQQDYPIGSKCMWDNSAKLVLLRTIQETGQTMEFIVPPDSIRRQSDGSWLATYSDIADRACSHYSYAVRIDQSEADLCVYDSTFLNAKPITGPELYFDESATITRFTATQGDATTAMKNGVLLLWEASNDAVDGYIVTRVEKGTDVSPDTIYRGENTDFFDRSALPNTHYEYTVATHYSCNGKHTSNSATTEGWRTPYGEISGHINMVDNSGMAGVRVVLQDSNGVIIDSLTTDASGFFRFDSLIYGKTSVYAVIPTSQYGTFSYNNTSTPSATVTISVSEAVGNGIDFFNTSSTRLSGRLLYKMSTIPVPGAMFLLNGDTVRRGTIPVTTGTDGNFELTLPLNQPCKLQVFKPGHIFEGEGVLHVEQDKDTFTLTKPLDGVRFYDQTKVRLVGRVAGGNDQRDLKHGFGLGKNNLGDNLQLVIMLEGDNTAQLVYDPDDITLDSVEQTIDGTHTRFEKKRIILRPDPNTGEYAVDLFPVKYKVVQATATGYATLFTTGQGAETFDLVNAPLNQITDSLNGQKITYNAIYDRIYHNPVEIELKQILYGIEREGYGETEMEVSSLNPMEISKVTMYTKQSDGTISYLMGYPVFLSNRRYQFVARAYEEYVYNNDRNTGIIDRVAQRGGEIVIHNGLHSQTDTLQFTLNEKGENRAIWLEVDQIDIRNSGTNALRTVSSLLKTEGTAIETTAFRAYVSGVDFQSGDLLATESEVVLLDIIRDPAGTGSRAWVDAGSTYTFGFSEMYYWTAGATLSLQWGTNVSQDIGSVAAPSGAGSYLGSNFQTTRLLSIPVPVSHDWSWGYNYAYSVTTTENISTSGGMNPQDVGAPADVFFGTTVSQLSGKVNAVSVISDSLYQIRQPAIQAGLMKVLGEGTATDGKRYHLVTGQKTALGSKVNNTFIYTQDYVINTLIPKLAKERSNLLMDFPDSVSAQNYANSTGEAVYWNINNADKVNQTDSTPLGSYKMIMPQDNKVYTNRIAALDNMIREWVNILYINEKEKVNAQMGGSSKQVGTWSISAGASFTHTDSYTASAAYNEAPQSGWGNSMASNATEAASTLAGDWKNIVNFFRTIGDKKIGETIGSALEKIGDLNNVAGNNAEEKKAQQQNMGSKTNASQFNFEFKPNVNYLSDADKSTNRSITKNSGFFLASDNMGDLTVAVYRAHTDSVWTKETSTIRNKTGVTDDDKLYGSYVFYTLAGTTYCPHEEEEKTKFYNAGTLINNETQWASKPELSIDVHEQSAVMPDKRAVFHVTLMNNAPVQVGRAAMGNQFDLSVMASSNPNGARITMDGQPLTQSIGFWLTPGVPVTKTLEVERGTVDDYENLTLSLGLTDCPITYSTLNFSVHFLPVSSPVEITSPRQNWTMNTLSPRDSIGYYLPVEIDGFDIHHKNFDHIEFQYKLSTQSDDDWVNQCSFYADKNLYALATGNKAMIENGRIVPFRFYGERDPKELKYDLRAVTFCRFGSGFVTKSSPVMSGTKDTRPPVVFGNAEPANGILGIGDHLRLRFSEPIAGNWLDEDNNFQLIGITNETSPTTDASPHFTGSSESYAISSVNRSLSSRSFSIDMMVKPTNPNDAVTFFTHGLDGKGIVFGRTADNRLLLQTNSTTIYSKQLPNKMLEFTRVIITYDESTNAVRFFAGTLDVTDGNSNLPTFNYQLSAPLVFGRGMEGNILETRVWTKALTTEEVAATHMRYLTGHEQELMAYYRMNEGIGTTLRDRSSGAFLTMKNASWNLPKGISLALEKNDRVTLDRNLLSRSTVYDGTYMLWVRPTTDNGTIFSAGDKNFAMENGKLVFHYGDQLVTLKDKLSTDTWHHIVLVINRTYNNVAVYLDGQMTATFTTDRLSGITGDMYFGGNGFEGNIDEFVVFEQALPKTFITEFGNRTPIGNEMGLMAYLPFEQQIQNPNGVLEQVFSINDQRIFYDPKGNVISKVVPLLIDYRTDMADKTNYAPVSGIGLMSKLNFNWTYNNDELLINLKMADYEINHQPVLVTVRDVEDMNGNPMPSPVMWMATVDRNALKWYDTELRYETTFSNQQLPTNSYKVDFAFFNQTGLRHLFSIESLPDWLTVDENYGTIGAITDKTIRFYFNPNMPVGTYSDYIYLTDENGLSEPLRVEYSVEATFPYKDVNKNKYPHNMSVCGEVKIGDIYDTDSNDRVIAFFRNECIGMANVSFDPQTNKTQVFLTIHGNDTMFLKEIHFQLWQASTGKILELTPSREVLFEHGSIYDCGSETPLVLYTSGSETQTIILNNGWNWISFNLQLPTSAIVNDHIFVDQPWTEGDIIKNPATQQFVTYSDSLGYFAGTLTNIDYQQMYMVYTQNNNVLRISGNPLEQKYRYITLRGNGHWNSFPCLFNEVTPITDAMADYYDYATPGDLLKAHDHFAYFSQDKKWVGDLNVLRPGEGYLFLRIGDGTVDINFYDQSAKSPNRTNKITPSTNNQWNNHTAPNNMTMIARAEIKPTSLTKQTIRAFINDELVGIATPIDSLYFITISSNTTGSLYFETEDGTVLHPFDTSKSQEYELSYQANSHHGSIKTPVILKPSGTDRARKVIENNRLIIIRNGKRYDVTGNKIQ